MVDFEAIPIRKDAAQHRRGIIAARRKAHQMLIRPAIRKLDNAQAVAPCDQPHGFGINRDGAGAERALRQVFFVQINSHVRPMHRFARARNMGIARKTLAVLSHFRYTQSRRKIDAPHCLMPLVPCMKSERRNRGRYFGKLLKAWVLIEGAAGIAVDVAGTSSTVLAMTATRGGGGFGGDRFGGGRRWRRLSRWR
jgi:hypothetical protein